MIRHLMAALFPERERRIAQPCRKPDCPIGLHYHWGWGQRRTSPRPVTGPNSFSSGEPFYKER